MTSNEILRKYLKSPKHKDNVDFISSFFNCFSNLLQTTHETLYNLLESNKDSRLFMEMTKLEFGNHSRWISKENLLDEKSRCYPLLFMLALISNTYKRRIVLICDDYNLTFIHKGRSIVCVQPDGLIEQNDMLLTLTDYNILNQINLETESDKQKILSRLRNATSIDLEKYKYDPIKTFPEPKQRSKFRPLNRERSENSFTVQDFISQFSTENEHEMHILPEAYSNDSRINYKLSDYRIQEGLDVDFIKTFDVDGFFSIVNPMDLSSCINSGGKMVKFRDSSYKIHKKSIKKILADTSESKIEDATVVKIAELDDKHGIEIFAVAVTDSMEKTDYKNSIF